MNSREVVEVQIGRPPRSEVVVSKACHFDLPVVTVVPPHLEDGTPFPTTYWLTCPLLLRRVSRVESGGGVRAFDKRIATDAEFSRQYDRAMVRYSEHRGTMIVDASLVAPSGGIAGSRGGVKCLHAHVADTLAGNDNPVGHEVAGQVLPLDCVSPCVVAGEVVPEWNQAWVEPQHEGCSD